MPQFVKVARKSEIENGSGKCIEVQDKQIAVFNVDGKFYAIDDGCTHEEGPLSEGAIEGDEVTCPWHEAVFNIKTGRCMAPPAEEDVASYNVRIVGEDVEVEL